MEKNTNDGQDTEKGGNEKGPNLRTRWSQPDDRILLGNITKADYVEFSREITQNVLYQTTRNHRECVYEHANCRHSAVRDAILAESLR